MAKRKDSKRQQLKGDIKSQPKGKKDGKAADLPDVSASSGDILAEIEGRDALVGMEGVEDVLAQAGNDDSADKPSGGREQSDKERITAYYAGCSREAIEQDLRQLWADMRTREDLLELVNSASYLLYGDNMVCFRMGQLNYYAYSATHAKRYVQFKVPKKKRGEYRTIDAPVPTLKRIQACLNAVLQLVYKPHPAAHGFVQGRSVVSNARHHVGQDFVYNIDLKDFFPSITSGRIFKRLMAKPFSLPEGVASMVANLCCYEDEEDRNVLPQGAPTSPTLTNIMCERMDRQLKQLADSVGLRYSRYADDITFSGMVNVFSPDGKFCQRLHHIIEEQEHLHINPDKTRLAFRGQRQEVTGLTVNNRINVSRQYVKSLRMMLHIWETYEYAEAQRIFAEHYKATKTRRHGQKTGTKIENVIAGKLLYLKMVKGDADSTYAKLYERFAQLVKADLGIALPPSNGATDSTAAMHAGNPTTNSDTVISDDQLLALFASLGDMIGQDDENQQGQQP